MRISSVPKGFISGSSAPISSVRRSSVRSSAAHKPLFFSAIAAILLMIVSCGGNSMMTMSARQLQSITVSPTSADAKNSGGMVQFTATGNFNMDPMTAMTPVRWSIGNPFSAQPVPAGVSVDMNGLAQCSGFNGMVTIEATAPMDPNMPLSKMTMMTMNVSGMAQLTCP
jgi:hypothetical protein